MSTKPHNGTLKNAWYNKAIGWVEGNVHGAWNFDDGVYIHTSRIVKIDGNEIETLNSRYTAEWNDGQVPSLD